MGKKIKGALFDMDGTLTESMRYWRFSSLEYCLRHGYPLEDDILTRMESTSANVILPEVTEKWGQRLERPDFIGELHGYMERHYRDEVQKKPGVEELLRELSSRGVRMGIATLTVGTSAAMVMKKLGLYGYFSMIAGDGDIPYSKGMPEYWLYAAERLGTDPRDTVVFEDTVYNVLGAKKAGMRVCAVEDGTQFKKKEETMRESDLYVSSWDLLTPEQLDELFR